MGDPRQTARQRALNRLAKLHPADFDVLHDQEREAVNLPPVQPRNTERLHGRGGYVYGCRCAVCTKANREYQRRYMELHRLGITLTGDP